MASDDGSTATGNGSQAGGPVLLERSGHVAELRLTNPARRNPLSLAVMGDLAGHLRRLGDDPSVRAIVVSGTGPAFSAGHDLKEMVDRPDDFYVELFDACCDLMDAIRAAPQPVVAAVDGVATAAGCQLVAACDLAIATDRSRFATPGVRIGLFCSTPMVPLSRAVGRKRAMEMLLTGDLIDAATAADWGLVNSVVAPEELRAALDDLTGRIGRFSPTVLAIGKRAFYDQLDRSEPEAYDYTRRVMAANAAMADAQEGIEAFLQKRPPVWPEPDPRIASGSELVSESVLASASEPGHAASRPALEQAAAVDGSAASVPPRPPGTPRPALEQAAAVPK